MSNALKVIDKIAASTKLNKKGLLYLTLI